MRRNITNDKRLKTVVKWGEKLNKREKLKRMK